MATTEKESGVSKRRKKTDEANEFLTPAPATPESPAPVRAKKEKAQAPDESEQTTLASVIKKLGSDPEFLRSLEERARAGRLTPAESRLVLDTLRSAPEKPKETMENWEAMLIVADERDREVIGRCLRKAIAYKQERGLL